MLRSELSLNGWWGFCPSLTEDGKRHCPPGDAPAEGAYSATVLVPGSWSRGGERSAAEPAATAGGDMPWKAWRIGDNYGYPTEWDETNTACYRRTLELDDVRPGQRFELDFGGILREAWVFVNGVEVGRSTNATMPCRFDVTDALRTGENELVVYVTDYRRDEQRKTFVPYGADQMEVQKGIWQDVRLLSHGDLFVEDVTIRTSVRQNMLTVLLTLVNRSPGPRTVTPVFAVRDGCLQELPFECPQTTLAAGETRQLTVEQPWTAYRPWSPASPQLYFLETRLMDASAPVDCHVERFGFREVWIDGHRK